MLSLTQRTLTRQFVPASTCITQSHVLRSLSTAVTTTPPVDENRPAKVVYVQPEAQHKSRSEGGISTKLGSFFVGVAITALLGYGRLQYDVWNSAAALEEQIQHLNTDIQMTNVNSNKELQQRIINLEARIAAIEKFNQQQQQKK